MTLSLARASTSLAASRRLRVLIVDDDASCAGELADAISEMGAETRVCLRGADALATARAFDPSLIAGRSSSHLTYPRDGPMLNLSAVPVAGD